MVLSDFSAVCQAETPLVAWETVMEIDTRGYNLYRGPTASGWDTRLNTYLIPPANPGGAGGSSYQWLDSTAAVGEEHYYWLEDVFLSGVTTQHGPVSVMCPAPTAVRLNNLDAASPVDNGAVWWLAALALVVLLGGLAVAQRRSRA